jgi:hypothetical protein
MQLAGDWMFGPTGIETKQLPCNDYAQTAGAMRTTAAGVNHAQPDDPAKAAAAIVHIAGVADPPLRIQLGRDSHAAIANKLAFVAGEQKIWHDLSVSTDHDEITPVRITGFSKFFATSTGSAMRWTTTCLVRFSCTTAIFSRVRSDLGKLTVGWCLSGR